jgi:hypothetical protein
LKGSIKRGAVSVLMAVIASTSITGCALFRKQQVEDTPEPAETPVEVVETEPPVEETEPPVEQAPPVVEPPAEAEPPEGPPEVAESEAEPAEVEPPPATEKPEADKAPPPTKPVADKKKETIPAVDEVSPVETEQPEPRLIPKEEEKLTPEALRDEFREAQTLSTELTGRKLTEEQRAQVESGRGFLDDAREALRLQDVERAGVLLEKCLVLLRDAKANSGS